MAQLAGEDILASDIQVPGVRLGTSTQSVTSSTTLVNATDFAIILTPGRWRLEAFIHATGAAAGDININWTNTGTMTGLSRSTNGPGFTVASVTDATVRIQSLAVFGSSAQYGLTGSTYVIHEDILIDVSVAGTVQLQFAQTVSNATATSIVGASSKIYVTAVDTI
jgi:hypothetical protein